MLISIFFFLESLWLGKRWRIFAWNFFSITIINGMIVTNTDQWSIIGQKCVTKWLIDCNFLTCSGRHGSADTWDVNTKIFSNPSLTHVVKSLTNIILITLTTWRRIVQWEEVSKGLSICVVTILLQIRKTKRYNRSFSAKICWKFNRFFFICFLQAKRVLKNKTESDPFIW